MQVTRSRHKRGRPRAFDADAALDAALTVFWSNGYEGTSLADLTAAMGINRPSLYATFGNKESLFRRAMDRYSERGRSLLAECESEPTSRGFIKRLLQGLVERSTACPSRAGCFLLQGAMKCSASATSIKQAATECRQSMQAVVRDRFDRARKEGELPPDADVDGLAVYYAAVMHGISVHAADGVDRIALQRLVDVAMRAWPVCPLNKDLRPGETWE